MAKFDWGLAVIAKSKNDPCLLAVDVGPLLAGAEAQACLQAAHFLAPGGEGHLLLLFRQLLGSLYFQSHHPGSEFAQSGVQCDSPGRRVSKNPLIFDPEYSRSTQSLEGNFIAVLTC